MLSIVLQSWKGYITRLEISNKKIIKFLVKALFWGYSKVELRTLGYLCNITLLKKNTNGALRFYSEKQSR